MLISHGYRKAVSAPGQLASATEISAIRPLDAALRKATRNRARPFRMLRPGGPAWAIPAFALCTPSQAQIVQPPRSAPAVDAMPACPNILIRTISLQKTTIPAVGQQRTVDVGEPVVVSKTVALRELALQLPVKISFSAARDGKTFVVDVPPATYSGVDSLAFMHHVSEWSYRLPNASISYVDPNGNRGKPASATLWLSTSKDGSTLHGDLKLGSSIMALDLADHPATRLLCIDEANRSIRSEIVFGGVSKGTVTLQYREFSGGLARPAFSQEATFDLSAGQDIAFKGIRIKILSANNAGIRYVVTDVRPS